MHQPKFLDFFCGIGGLSLGLRRAGLREIGGIDNWQDACRTYEFNHSPTKCLNADIAKLTVDDLASHFGISSLDVDIMVGGPPCQGFSTIGKRDSKDPRNKLWEHYLKLVDKIRPAYVLIENVEGLVVMDKGGVCESIVASLNSIGYNAEWRLLRSADFGVPQLRKRVIFMAALEGLRMPDFPKPLKTKQITVMEAIGDLPPLDSGTCAEFFSIDPQSEYQRQRRQGALKLFNHEAAKHPKHIVEMLSHIPDGGNRKSIPDHLQPKSGFHNSYARLASNKPAIAITSNMRKPSSARATHPVQNRGLTVREGLRLQTFDDSFIVLGTRSSQYLQVGNAVPPLLGEAIGREILRAYMLNSAESIAAVRQRLSFSVAVSNSRQFELALSS